MLPLFMHEQTKIPFVLHFATDADRRRNKSGDAAKRRQVKMNHVPVKFAPIKKKPREEAWKAYRQSGTRYH
jgi:hypothetical protein